jgi:hypothetical protein
MSVLNSALLGKSTPARRGPAALSLKFDVLSDSRVYWVGGWEHHERCLDSATANGCQRKPARKKLYANILTVFANR